MSEVIADFQLPIANCVNGSALLPGEKIGNRQLKIGNAPSFTKYYPLLLLAILPVFFFFEL